MRLPHLSVISAVIVFAVMTGACTEKPESGTPARLVGAEKISVSLFADHYDVLSDWARKGYRNRTVIHAGPKDGLSFVPAERMKAVRTLLEDGRTTAARRGEVTSDNYLFVASRLGLIDRVFWIIPFKHLDFLNAEERVRFFLRGEASYFRPKDIDGMKFENGCVSGTLAGVIVSICSPATLPPLTRPAILTIDTGFFPPYAAQKSEGSLGAMKEFFALLFMRKIRSPDVSVIGSPELPAMRGYLSEEVMAILKEPTLIWEAKPPALWISRDLADSMLTGGGIDDAVRYLDANIGAYPDDPSLLMMRATAHLLRSGKPSALGALAERCARTELFCRGIADAAVLLRERGDLKDAEAVFAKALSLRPDIRRTRFEYARTLYQAGKYASAGDEAREIVSDPLYRVSGALLLGDCAYALKRDSDALRWYEVALKAYRDEAGRRPRRWEQESLDRLKALYAMRNDREGLRALEQAPSTE